MHSAQFGHQRTAVNGQIVRQIRVGDGDMDCAAFLLAALGMEEGEQFSADGFLL